MPSARRPRKTSDALAVVGWDDQGIPRIDGRVVLNTAPLHVPCVVCSVNVGEICDLENPERPGVPHSWHSSRVLVAEEAGFQNDCTPERRNAMLADMGKFYPRGRAIKQAIDWLRRNK